MKQEKLCTLCLSEGSAKIFPLRYFSSLISIKYKKNVYIRLLCKQEQLYIHGIIPNTNFSVFITRFSFYNSHRDVEKNNVDSVALGIRIREIG